MNRAISSLALPDNGVKVVALVKIDPPTFPEKCFFSHSSETKIVVTLFGEFGSLWNMPVVNIRRTYHLVRGMFSRCKEKMRKADDVIEEDDLR